MISDLILIKEFKLLSFAIAAPSLEVAQNLL